MSINKEKINKFVEQEERHAESLLKESLLKEDEVLSPDDEKEQILSDLADEPADVETIGDIETDEELDLPGDENPIGDEETLEDELAEYIDVTGFVDVTEDGDGFSVNKDVEVSLAPGNKIKFTVNEEEYRGTVESIDEETGLATITVDEEEEIEGSEEIDINDEEGLEGTGMETDELPEEEIEDESEETIIEGLIKEGPLDEPTEQTIAPTADQPAETVPEVTPTGGEGGEAGGLDALTVGTGEVGNETETDMGDTGEVSLGSGGSMSMGGGAPAGGEGSEEGVGGTEEVAPTMTQDVATEMSDDVNQIISDLINDDSELDKLAGLNEGDLIEESDGRKPLKTEEPKDKVKSEKQPAKKEVKIDNKSPKKLDTEDLTKKVVDKGKGHENPEEIKDKVKEGGDGHTKPEEPKDKVKGEAEKSVKDKKATGKPVATMKIEAVKSKALELLAEKHITLQQEVEKLKFENYKLLKVNGLLTLGHELSPETKVALVEKFDKCSTSKQALELYKKVVGVIKESRKPSLNSIIASKNSGMKSLNSLTESTDKNKDKSIEYEGPTAEEKRALHLSGVKGYEDSYMQ